MRDAVAEELLSSVLWQEHAYTTPPPHAPTLASPAIAWEQCIIEGHPTHPMHKARRAMPPLPPLSPGSYDWQHPLLRLALVPRARVRVLGPWEACVRALGESVGIDTVLVPRTHILLPVHELQLPNVAAKFPDVTILPERYSVPALAQQSLRSVILPATHPTAPSLPLKLPLGVRLTSALRTISPPSAQLGVAFCTHVLPRMRFDRTLLEVQREVASVVGVCTEEDMNKHLAGIVRADCARAGETAIVCTALVEVGYGAAPDTTPDADTTGMDPGKGEIPLVQRVFGLDTPAKRLRWLDTFVDLFLRAVLPPVLRHGVAFEAHPQNTLARFDSETGALKGFVVRDFGGVRVHAATLLASLAPSSSSSPQDAPHTDTTGPSTPHTHTTDPTASTLPPLTSLTGIIDPTHSILAPSLADVYTRLYHTVVHNHLQQLIRVLGLHYDGTGWGVLRRRLREHVPRGHELARVWWGPGTEEVDGKCFVRMRMEGMYRIHLHGPFANLLHYRGEGREDDMSDGEEDPEVEG
ncbi:hypothetical protein K439DRAFT_1414494 [Ramaria rubella]|nr:hypothetical protein K439DRAFT_1414494 [Ramaria rubella]